MSPRKIGLSPLLLGLPLIAVVPLLLYAAFLLWVTADQAQRATRRELASTDHAVAMAVENDFSQAEQALVLLAGSQAIDDEGRIDVARLAPLAERVTRARFGLTGMVLIDRDGRIAFSFPRQPDGSLRIPLLPHHVQAFEQVQTVVSPLHRSRVDGTSTISVNLPVVRRGEVRWVLSARLDPRFLAASMDAQLGNRDAVATLLDPAFIIAARTREMDRFFGERPSVQTVQALTSGPSGTRRFPTRDGNELLWAWETGPHGWHVMTGTPALAVDVALRDSMARLVIVGMAVLSLGVLASVALGRRIVTAADAMADHARRLLQGQDPPWRPSGIRQLDLLHERMKAATGLAARALAAERAARAVADEHSRAKDVFIATLSHELRNPLSPIRSAARVLRLPGADEARRRWATEVIERQTTAMARLLDDLLDISRVSRGRIQLDVAPVLLSEVLAEAVEVARPLVDQRRHELVLHEVPPDLVLEADRLRLTQVFANLLTNAAKYTEPGGRIELGARLARDDEVVITVSDNGIGLAPGSLESIFGIFTQVRGRQDASQGGLGIGLALVRGLVELHGGWVAAHSEGLGRGSEFSVGLPVVPGLQGRGLPRDGDAAVAPSPGPSGGVKVLVADDNEDAATTLRQMLELAGHEVRVVHGGEDALHAARAWRPDAACIDIGMPDMSGYDVARHLRAEPWGQAMRLVAITGWGTPDDKRRAHEAGFDAHLTKPADPDAVLRTLQPR